jgi:hypothetical protein
MAAERAELESRTLAEARLDDGQRLLALNEIFAGHRSHQSARYRLSFGGRSRRTFTGGCTGFETAGAGASGATCLRGTPFVTKALRLSAASV